MRLIRSLRLLGLSLICLLTFCGAVARAEHTSICNNSALLRRAVQIGGPTQSVVTPASTMSDLGVLSAELHAIVGANSGTTLPELDATLSKMVATIEGADRDNGTLGAALYQVLSRNDPALAQLEDMFGCRDAVQQATGSEESTPGPAFKLPSFGSSVGRSFNVPVTANILLFASLVTSLVSSAWLIFRRRDRESRLVCHTAAQLVFGDKCTMTHIIDITRSGAKVEASQLDAEGAWLTLYFCGHEIKCKCVWRNKFYAGIRFQSKISKQSLGDIILKSHMAIEESGLEDRAMYCFSTGCHLDCPRHLVTALSQERLANETNQA